LLTIPIECRRIYLKFLEIKEDSKMLAQEFITFVENKDFNMDGLQALASIFPQTVNAIK
jgi:hypothetical protein